LGPLILFYFSFQIWPISEHVAELGWVLSFLRRLQRTAFKT